MSSNHLIDLSQPCKLPFENAERVSPAKPGIVKLEKRGGNLHLDGVKLDLFLSENQTGGEIIDGHDLRRELEAKGGNVGAVILDHLVRYPGLWPDSWKKDAKGNRIYVFFWDDVFRNQWGHRHRLYVRCGFWHDHAGMVMSGYSWLGGDWHGDCPAASRAS